MDLTQENYRAIIFYNFKRKLSPKNCVAELVSVFGDEAPSRAAVYRWYSEFQRGRTSLGKQYGGGPSKTAVVPENIDAVRQLIKEDRHVTYREIQASLGISGTSVEKILHQELGVRKLISRWIPHLLTNDQKAARVNWCRRNLQRFNGGASNHVYDIVSGDESWIYSYEPESKVQSAVWVFQDEAKPTKVIRSRSVSKKMVASFVGKSGHIATIALEDRRTVNADWYTTACLPEVINELRKTNKNRRILLHHDNASSHTARRTTEFLEAHNVEILDHPPYSPDLSPNDFFTFPRIKKQLRGKRFQTPEQAVEAYKIAISSTPTSDWNYCFAQWFERMQKCINVNGEYFEKQ
jgi:[histone H3]-lysine36 N-dimethyltransferase SETMAR